MSKSEYLKLVDEEWKNNNSLPAHSYLNFDEFINSIDWDNIDRIYNSQNDSLHALCLDADLDPSSDLVGLDLSNIDFTGIDIRGVNLFGCNLENTNIKYAITDNQNNISRNDDEFHINEFVDDLNRQSSFDINLDYERKIISIYFSSEMNPKFDSDALADLKFLQNKICSIPKGEIIKYVIFGSNVPSVFSLGEDLRSLSEINYRKDKNSLIRYYKECNEVLSGFDRILDAGIITIGLVQGDALGFGFEFLLNCDLIFAEKSSRMGLPQIIFNMPPLINSFQKLQCRVGANFAEKAVFEGRIYSAQELHDLGLVRSIFENGEGASGVVDWILRNSSASDAHLSILRNMRIAAFVSDNNAKVLLKDWVGAMSNLKEADIRKMLRLADAQDRRMQRHGVTKNTSIGEIIEMSYSKP